MITIVQNCIKLSSLEVTLLEMSYLAFLYFAYSSIIHKPDELLQQSLFDFVSLYRNLYLVKMIHFRCKYSPPPIIYLRRVGSNERLVVERLSIH